jgi:transcriptional regulator with XRE-family HTH domain
VDDTMKIDAKRIRKLREELAWSQEHLATVAGLSLRTIQRVEAEGLASLDTRMALAAAFKVLPGSLLVDTAEGTMPEVRPSRYSHLVNPILWAIAILASAWFTKSTILSVILLPALASTSLIVADQKRKRCARAP